MKFLLMLIVLFTQIALADVFLPLHRGEEAFQARVDFIQRAKYNIELTYFIWKDDRTGFELLALLREAARRGVAVRIIVDSSFNDIPHATRAYLRDLDIVVRDYNPFEYTGKHSVHIKSAVIDDKWALIGSYNLDPLSANRNTEALVILEDEAVAKDLKAVMDSNLENAERIDENGRHMVSKKKYPNTTFKKVLMTTLIRYLVAPFFKGFF